MILTNLNQWMTSTHAEIRLIRFVAMDIYCCGCGMEVEPRLTNGAEIYPHRNDLSQLPFWKCDSCGNFVGCHHKTKERTKPLGCIPTKEIKNARKHIHSILDPLWKSGKYKRSELYTMIGAHFVCKYHTAEIRTIEQAREVYRFIKNISEEK